MSIRQIELWGQGLANNIAHINCTVIRQYSFVFIQLTADEMPLDNNYWKSLYPRLHIDQSQRT